MPKKRPVYKRCPYCKGTGDMQLAPIYADTLTILRRLTRKADSYVVANADAERFGCEPTALNNRLAGLERMGFAVSEIVSRQRRFRAL